MDISRESSQCLQNNKMMTQAKTARGQEHLALICSILNLIEGKRSLFIKKWLNTKLSNLKEIMLSLTTYFL
jgi:hypothetical protein